MPAGRPVRAHDVGSALGGRRFGIAGPRSKHYYTTTHQQAFTNTRIVPKQKTVTEIQQQYFPTENYLQAAIKEQIPVTEIEIVKILSF